MHLVSKYHSVISYPVYCIGIIKKKERKNFFSGISVVTKYLVHFNPLVF